MNASCAEVRNMQDAPAEWLRRIWERFTSLYGHAWTSVHGVTPHDAQTFEMTMDGDTWGKALAGLDAQQLAAGVSSCIADGGEFPPSAPRFRGMCIGIPSLAAVRSELRQQTSSPFALAVWQELDTFRLKQVSADQAERMVRDAYDLLHEQVMRGRRFVDKPVAEIAHEAREFKSATPEQVRAHCKTIRALLEGGAP